MRIMKQSHGSEKSEMRDLTFQWTFQCEVCGLEKKEQDENV